jgi:transposase
MPEPVQRDPSRRALRTRVDRQAVAAAYQQGMTIRQCAVAFGIAQATVANVLDREGVPRRRHGRVPARGVDEDALLARYRAGLSVSACAREFGISRDVATGILNRRGVPRRPPARVNERAVVAAYQRSRSVRECAREFGITRRTAIRVLDRHRISRTPGIRKPLSGPDVQALVAAYRSGLSVRRCADRFAIHPYQAARLLDEQGIPRRTRPSVDPAELVAAYRDEGLTVRQCADRFGVGRDTAARALRRSGVPIRGKGGYRVPAIDQEIIAAYRDQELTIRECADRFGIGRSMVCRVLERNGVPTRPRGWRHRLADGDPGRQPLAFSTAALIAAYRDQGLTMRQCADRFGISSATVSRILGRNEVAARGNRCSPAVEKLVIAAYRDGRRLTLQQCAAAAGVSTTTVTAILRRNGIAPRDYP